MKISIITIIHNDKEFIPLIINNYNNFVNKEDCELIIIDDGINNLISEFSTIDNCYYIHLNKNEKNIFFDKITENIDDKLENKDDKLLSFEKKRNRLPMGFLRDYGCGLSNNEYIFHMNYDCIYHPKSIIRKIRYLDNNKAECIYCDKVLCYNIYNKDLYKSESDYKLYESTLFHNKEFWKRKGFNWSDIMNEGKLFQYNEGNCRLMDNYYDTIQLLSIHNINKFKPIQITLDGIDIEIPNLISSIEIKEHPFKKYINELYNNDNIQILGYHSEFLDEIEIDDNWNIINIKEKIKQNKLTNYVNKYNKEFNIFLFCDKNPIWDIFEKISFNIIFLETHKNYEQMKSILLNNKNFKYLDINGLFINSNFL
jgi:hypothetical protein